MQPNDMIFVALLALVTIAIIVLAVLTWKRGKWQLGRRLGLVFLAQIMVLLTLAGYVNADQGFYTTWGDLFGVPSTDNQAHEVFNRPVQSTENGTGPDKLRREVTGLGGRILTSLVDRNEATKSRIVETMLRGKRTRYDLSALVYLPGSYFNKSERKRKYPVVELLAGYPGSPYAWVNTLGMKQYLDAEIKAGRAPAMIVVMPRQDPNYPQDSECVNAVGGAQAATYLGEDVPDAVAKLYRARTDRHSWALMGYSTGGFCAANLALLFPKRFSAAASLSGYFTAITDNTTGDLYRGNAAAQQANSPLWSVANRPHPPLSFFLFAAVDSVDDTNQAVTFSKAVKAPDGVRLTQAASGGHTRIGWNAVQPQAWDWLGNAIA
ncbi:alpha/beta hydrolase [Fodinicola acaciae]|uniref:alpha/beta hydrolase n=1 Tax=Fodinicola acaciae TaxID=2681555 RepID=UPI0013D04070|nr:alpha/beta fold hydrolase [Fodinicola acaciae]